MSHSFSLVPYLSKMLSKLLLFTHGWRENNYRGIRKRNTNSLIQDFKLWSPFSFPTIAITQQAPSKFISTWKIINYLFFHNYFFHFNFSDFIATKIKMKEILVEKFIFKRGSLNLNIFKKVFVFFFFEKKEIVWDLIKLWMVNNFMIFFFFCKF